MAVGKSWGDMSEPLTIESNSVVISQFDVNVPEIHSNQQATILILFFDSYRKDMGNQSKISSFNVSKFNLDMIAMFPHDLGTN